MSLLSDARERLQGSPVLAPFASGLLLHHDLSPTRDAYLRRLLTESDRAVFALGQVVGVVPPTVEAPRAAALLGVSDRRVRQLMAPGGPLVAFDFGDGRAKLVTLASVEAYKAGGHTRGSRRHCQITEVSSGEA
jgi:hypothetical protein